MRKGGKCAGCARPVPFEVDNAALGLLEGWIDGSRKLSDENLSKVIRLVERRRYQTEVLDQAYLKRKCRFPDMTPREVDVAMRVWRNELAAFARGECGPFKLFNRNEGGE